MRFIPLNQFANLKSCNMSSDGEISFTFDKTSWRIIRPVARCQAFDLCLSNRLVILITSVLNACANMMVRKLRQHHPVAIWYIHGRVTVGSLCCNRRNNIKVKHRWEKSKRKPAGSTADELVTPLPTIILPRQDYDVVIQQSDFH